MLNPVTDFAVLGRSRRRLHLRHELRQGCARHILTSVQQAFGESVSSLCIGFHQVFWYLDLRTTFDRLLEGPRHNSCFCPRGDS